MSMGTRKRRVRQQDLWISADALPRSASHPFYQRLNQILNEHQFDAFVEGLCRSFYSEPKGRPSLVPGMYFRLLLVGYFEGIDSERGIAWRAADSLSIRSFVQLALDEEGPDHSTISRTRRRLDLDTHKQVFQWVLGILAEHGLLKGRTLAIDATTLEANAALRSIVRRDTGESYEGFLTRLAQESGIETPSREDLSKLDRKRPKKGSNTEWTSPQDPDARITKMKDGRTHLSHKAEHAVDVETGAVVAVTLQCANKGDTSTLPETLAEAGERIADTAAETNDEEVGERVDPEGPVAVIADKGYHSRKVVRDLQDCHVRSYISEPKRGRQQWKGQQTEQHAVYSNRRRIRGNHGKQLLRLRGERVERTFAHIYDTGGMRRTHLRQHANILKRLLIHVGAFNLGLVLRTLLGKGTPRGMHGASPTSGDLLLAVHLAVIVFSECRHRKPVTSGRSATPYRHHRCVSARFFKN